MPSSPINHDEPTFQVLELSKLSEDLIHAHDGLPSLRVLYQLRQVVEDQVAQHARLAFDRGATWTEVGDALRVSRQGAWERYGAR